jgi:hypothetical protein
MQNDVSSQIDEGIFVVLFAYLPFLNRALASVLELFQCQHHSQLSNSHSWLVNDWWIAMMAMPGLDFQQKKAVTGIVAIEDKSHLW